MVTLLKSSDARDQAWGAWRSLRDNRLDLVPLLVDVVAHRHVGVSTHDRAATDQALDALIQLRASVSPELARLVLERRPAQAMALLSQSREDVHGTLLELIAHDNGLVWFAAANIALTRRTPGLAAAVLADLTLSASLVIADDGEESIYGSVAGLVIGCGVETPAFGLPPWPTYDLTTSAYAGVVVIAGGPTPMYYARSVARAGWTPASRSVSIPEPSARDRFKYLAAVAGLQVDSMPLSGDGSYSVRRREMRSRDAEVARVRRDMLQRYQHVVSQLTERGALTREEAAALPPPPVTVTVHDA